MNICSDILRTTIVILSTSFLTISTDRCCRIGSRESPSYKLSQREKRSTVTIISRRDVADLDKCEKFSVSKKALAFNYRKSRSRNYDKRDNWNDLNCQALECPATNNFESFINDTAYDYYSIYPSRISTENGSVNCLPSVGMFYISQQNLNYTNARESCRKMRATLAHVISEERTEGLGKMITEIPTFVGLSNRDKERLWKNEFEEPLSCFDYRGWATNEPANSRGCVVLLSPKHPRSSSSWKVVPCSRKLPYICEIAPRVRRHFPQNYMHRGS